MRLVTKILGTTSEVHNATNAMILQAIDDLATEVEIYFRETPETVSLNSAYPKLHWQVQEGTYRVICQGPRLSLECGGMGVQGCMLNRTEIETITEKDLEHLLSIIMSFCNFDEMQADYAKMGELAYWGVGLLGEVPGCLCLGKCHVEAVQSNARGGPDQRCVPRQAAPESVEVREEAAAEDGRGLGRADGGVSAADAC